MKFFKKATIFCLSLLACCSFAFAVACGDDPVNSNSSSSSSSVDEEQLSYTYRVAVQNQTGFGLEDVSVALYDGSEKVAQSTTNSNGYAYFRDTDDKTITIDEYKVVLDDLPAGYDYADPDNKDNYHTVMAAGTQVVVPLKPTGVIKEGSLPEGQLYELGDVVYDFTVKTSEGENFNLTRTLNEKKLVVVNLWYISCGPCKAEFPVMKNAFKAYEETVDCIALSLQDSNDQVKNFRQENGIQFHMAGQGAGDGLSSKFTKAILAPQTILIDRYGVIVSWHAGSVTDLKEWTNLFDTFVGDEYTSTVLSGKDNDEDNPANPDGTIDRIEPTIPAPSTDEVHRVLGTTANEFNYRWQPKGVVSKEDENYDKYSWPWIVSKETEENGEEVEFLQASNAIDKLDWSYATLYADITVKAGDVLTFDYKIGSEKDCDVLYVAIDGAIVTALSGYYTEQWNTCYSYVFTEDEVGEHEITLLFNKDSDKTAYGDIVYLRNLRIESETEGIVNSDNTYVLRQAATVLNTDKNATTQFKKYETVVLNEEDNYYHVGSADGPILFADLLYATQWSNMSVWALVDGGYCVVEGFNYDGPFETHAWTATNNIIGSIYMYGLTPVTKELKDLLQICTQYIPYNAEWDKFDGAHHENEWLEICRYYQPYGKTEQLADPVETITFNAAKELYEGVANKVNVPYKIKPRGFKYKFIPTKSGAYKVYSTGTTDTVTFLVDEDQETFLGSWDNKVYADKIKDENGEDLVDSNFEYYWYFEAGKTYYMLFTTFMDVTASYEVHIDYIAETYTSMELANTIIYSANLITGELFHPDAIEYVFDKDYKITQVDGKEEKGVYRHVVGYDENGEPILGSPIYVDAVNPTTFSAKSLYQQADYDVEYNTPLEKRVFYINGKDYTERIQELGAWAEFVQDPIYRGYIPVTQEVYEFLYDLTVHTEAEGIYNTWLSLCYYAKELAPEK